MEDVSPDIYEEFMPHIVKSSKELLILSMILEHPMSAYDLMKKIFLKTNVLLSQGTVYPLLYLLEEAEILQAQYGTGDMRTKIYHLTPQGREIAQDKIDRFVQTFNHFITLIDPGIRQNPVLDLRLHVDPVHV